MHKKNQIKASANILNAISDTGAAGRKAKKIAFCPSMALIRLYRKLSSETCSAAITPNDVNWLERGQSVSLPRKFIPPHRVRYRRDGNNTHSRNTTRLGLYLQVAGCEAPSVITGVVFLSIVGLPSSILSSG